MAQAAATRRVSARMQQLLVAGVGVVAREGLRGLTHRAVDREARLPEGSCSAYLRTRLALLTALAEHVCGAAADDLRALSAQIVTHAEAAAPDVDYAVERTLEMFLSWVEHPELLQTRIELGLEGQRQQALAEVTDGWSRELLGIVEEMVRRKGHPHPEQRAATLMAAMDGVLQRALRERPEDRRIFLERSLRLLITALVATDG